MTTQAEARIPNEPILLFGAQGQVGKELQGVFRNHATFVALRRSELDLTDADAIRRMIREVRPRWILNAAAYTAVDKAESEPAVAYAINRDAIRIIGEESNALGIAVVHFSTDYVFDGTGAEPRRENDPTKPLGVYGASKLAGEEALLASGAPSFIFRTSWVYSAHGKNFLLTMLKLAGEREEIRIVQDQVGAPTSARDLAQMVHHVILEVERTAAQEQIPLRAAVARRGGLFHVCGAGQTSWFGFAEELLRVAHAKQLLGRMPKLTPIATTDYPTPARRPADSRMACDLLKERLGFVMPDWRESVEVAVEELLESRHVAMAVGNGHKT